VKGDGPNLRPSEVNRAWRGELFSKVLVSCPVVEGVSRLFIYLSFCVVDSRRLENDFPGIIVRKRELWRLALGDCNNFAKEEEIH